MPNFPIACDLNALANEERAWLKSGFTFYFSNITEVKKLPEGYGFRLANVDFETFMHIAKLAALSRLCCAFLKHEIVQESGSADVWLYMSGHAGTRNAIKSDIIHIVENGSNFMKMFTRIS